MAPSGVSFFDVNLVFLSLPSSGLGFQKPAKLQKGRLKRRWLLGRFFVFYGRIWLAIIVPNSLC